MKNAIIGGLLYLVFWITCIAGWITSIMHDYSDDNIALMIIDILIAPFGVVRGIGIMLGWW